MGLDGPPWPMGPGAVHRLHTRSAATGGKYSARYCANEERFPSTTSLSFPSSRCVLKKDTITLSRLMSDVQLTCLQKVGLVDYILSEDSDLLVFGSSEFTKVIFKINFDSLDGELIVLKEIFGSSNSDKLYSFSEDVSIHVCIVWL